MNPLEIDTAGVKAKQDAGDEFLFLDCREQDEYDRVHIEGTTLLPMSEIQERVAELEAHQQKEVIVHCHHGGRSLQVTIWLKQQGFANVRSMSGGIDEWAEKIEPGMERY
ncbi:MAG: rhodanese-like domain-containing protein [Planctomycetaceae bacterium]|nr:rhodanese-like domain-containing protein [bacterium]MDC0273884.1 rhodanese-like domain-containing protein [Planctomycetaceae bacterium]MDG2389243.1 rhodanese-like domain-containing protein [Planctomycetaceae bacterium]